MGHTKRVQNVILVSQNAQFGSKWGLSIRTISSSTMCGVVCMDIQPLPACRAINVRGNILFRKFHMCSVSVKLKLFNSYCASMYTPHLWWNYKKMSICKLQITYHNLLKMNIGLSKFESRGLPVLPVLLRIPNAANQ